MEYIHIVLSIKQMTRLQLSMYIAWSSFSTRTSIPVIFNFRINIHQLGNIFPP
jgi:hypothetical protein